MLYDPSVLDQSFDIIKRQVPSPATLPHSAFERRGNIYKG
jgi:hypothetical protein